MATILVADNRPAFVRRAKELLVAAGYDVVTASNPVEAAKILSSGGCDAAIIDYRLTDDSRTDRSGLAVAEKSDPNIPKIIVSDLAEKDDVMAAVHVGPDAQPVAVRFLAKDEIDPRNTKLTDAVRDALEIGTRWKRQVRERIGPELYRDYRHASRFANIQMILHIFANIAFVILMIWAAIQLHEGVWSMFFMIAGVMVGEVVNLLLAKNREALIKRADRNHAELLQAARFEQLLAACDSLADPEAIMRAKEELIRTTTLRWLGSGIAQD